MAFRLRRHLRGFIDCIIAATAAALGEGPVTEDADIHSIAGLLKSVYKVNVCSYRGLIAGQH
jgi:predicted nucleic acid-binding protein